MTRLRCLIMGHDWECWSGVHRCGRCWERRGQHARCEACEEFTASLIRAALEAGVMTVDEARARWRAAVTGALDTHGAATLVWLPAGVMTVDEARARWRYSAGVL